MAILNHTYFRERYTDNVTPLAIALIFAFIPLTGCNEDFQPELKGEQVLCLNSLITAGEPISVDVTHTWIYNQGSVNGDHTVKDAVVRIIANGEPVDDGYTAREGDLIRIEAGSETYGDAWAEVRVPRSPQVDSFTSETVRIDNAGNGFYEDEEENKYYISVSFNLSGEMKVRDIKGSPEFYRLTMDILTAKGKPDEEADGSDPGWDTQLFIGDFEYDAEPIFSEHAGIFESLTGSRENGYLFFSDRQFQGSEYTLHLRFRNNIYWMEYSEWDPALAKCGITFTLTSISESYYKWVNYLWHKNNGPLGDYEDLGLSDPMWGYSNVSTGAGVVAAQASATFTADLTDFILKSIREAGEVQ